MRLTPLFVAWEERVLALVMRRVPLDKKMRESKRSWPTAEAHKDHKVMQCILRAEMA